MRLIICLSFVVLSLSSSVCQKVMESIHSYKEVFNPLFSSESSVFSFDLLKIYEIGKADTLYRFYGTVAEENMVNIGGNIGLALLGNAVGGGYSSSYEIERGFGEISFDYSQFQDLFNGFREVYSYTQLLNNNTIEAAKNPQIVTKSVNGITLAAEHSAGAKDMKYFIKTENATFTLSNEELRELWISLGTCSKVWKSKLNTS